jgi:serine/threonine protein kinase/outer membrane protein assembly factor BamD (BamD/ComL family)
MTEHTLKPQTPLRDYVIKRVLGRGSFGVTYLAEKITEHFAVAIKEYFPVSVALRGDDGTTVNVSDSAPGGGEEFQSGLDKFLEESRTLGGLKSPHIVQVVDTFEYNGTAYMVMKYEEGGTLNRYLESHQQPLKEEQIFSVFIPLLEGLRTIHAKWLLHRDIKPENIYIRKDGSPLLIDFGTARHALSAKHGGMTEYLTPGFAPPEQYDRNADHGPWTDIYAVGTTMYYCVTRIKPYEGRFRTGGNDPVISATQAAPAMYDNELLETIDWMMNPDYQLRPQSVEEVLLRLQELQDKSPSETDRNELAEGAMSPAAGDKPGGGKQKTRAAAAGKTVVRDGSGEAGAKETQVREPPPREVHKATERLDTESLPEPVPAAGSPGKTKWIAAGAVGGVLVIAVVAYISLQQTPESPRPEVADKEATDKEVAGKKEPAEKQVTDNETADQEVADKEAADDKEGEDQEATDKGVADKAGPDDSTDEAAIAKAWGNTQAIDTVAAYSDFIGRYPDSKVAETARDRLQVLEEKEKERQRRIREIAQAWSDTRLDDTPQGYRDFLKKYPDTGFTALAEAKIKAFEEAGKKQAELKVTNMTNDWQDAVSKDTAQAYVSFIKKHPGSTYEKLARAKLAGMEKDFWRDAQDRNTARAYQEFIELYPESVLRTLAEAKLKTLQ